MPVCSYVKYHAHVHTELMNTHPHTYATHTCTHMYSHAHTTGPGIHVPKHMCTHNPHPTPTRHAAYTHAHIPTYPHLCLYNHACIHTRTSTPCTYTTPVHTHTHAPWIPHAHMYTYALHKHMQSVTNHTHPAHTHTHTSTCLCTHVHSHPRWATPSTRADTVHTVHTPHTCAQDLMPAHTQAALLGSLVFWQSENTSGHQMVTLLTTSLQLLPLIRSQCWDSSPDTGL